MDPIYLQKQLRENAEDVQQFYKELNEWGENIKKRQERDKNKPQRRRISSAEVAANEKQFNEQVQKLFNPSSSKPTEFLGDPIKKENKRIKGTDYAAWDKFDVDAYCSKMDKMETGEEMSDPETEEEEEVNDRLLQLADADKEKGNRFVKQGNWDEAIRCYTQAIDCYPYNAIYYANRALCYLKKESFHLAETDCTTALQIDKTYVKAYLRRAAAREGQKNFEGTIADLGKVFEYEPNNTEAHAILKRTERASGYTLASGVKKNPILKDVIERKEPKNTEKPTGINPKTVEKTKIECMNIDDGFNKNHLPEDPFIYGPGGDKVILLEAIQKCPRTRSKKPLKRVKVENVNFKSEQTLLFDNKIDKFQEMESITKPEEMEITSKYNLSELDTKIDKESENLSKLLNLKDLPENKNKPVNNMPKTSLQFYHIWNGLGNDTEKYKYLKKFNPYWLSDIFKFNMESNIFGEILEILCEYFVPNDDDYFGFLMGLAKVNRFSALVMFMTSKDQQCVQRIVDAMEKNNKYTVDDILYVKNAYELKN